MNGARFFAAWERFWFAAVSGAQLARVRLLLGLALLVKLTSTYGAVPRLWYGKFAPGFPAHEYARANWWSGAWHAPFIEALDITSFSVFRNLETALFVVAIAFALGLGGRITGVMVALLYGLVFNASSLAFSHNELLLLVSLTIVGTSPCADAYSLDALIRRRRQAPAPPLRSIRPLRMLQVLVSTIYAFTVIAKLNKGWLLGIALHDTLVRHAPRFHALRFVVDLLPASDWVYAPPMWLVLATETFLAAGFWFPRTRRAALVIGLLFHLGIELTMDVGAYSYAFCALYAAFFVPRANRG